MRLLTYPCALVCLATAALLQGQTKRAVQPSDCVTVKRFTQEGFDSPLQMSPAGNKVAYLVSSPDIAGNSNNVEVDVVNLDHSKPKGPRQLLVAQEVSGLRWIKGGSALTVLAKRKGYRSIVQIDAENGNSKVLFHIDDDIAEYSISEDGRTLAYAVEHPESNTPDTNAALQRNASGYRIALEAPKTTPFLMRDVFVSHLETNEWGHPERVAVRLPGVDTTVTSFPYVISLRLSVSPDGQKMAFSYVSPEAGLPSTWLKSTAVRAYLDSGASGSTLMLTPVVDLNSGKVSLPFTGPWVQSSILWSADSRSFSILSYPPVLSEWEKTDISKAGRRPMTDHLFTVDTSTGQVSVLRNELHGIRHLPMNWTRSNELLVQSADNVVSRMRLAGGVWTEDWKTTIPLAGLSKNVPLAGNGDVFIGDLETATVAPGLFLYRKGESHSEVLTTVNPQLEQLTFANVRDIHWKTREGFEADGLLFLPPGYDEHKRYPLVIQAYWAISNFFCDSGYDHYPAFAPQPIANAGMMYLIRIYKDGRHRDVEQQHYPKGYPGLLGEAAFETELYDSAVDQLDTEGLIDRTKIGLVGFSRSGWYAEFALTHGRTSYAAASIADNVQFSLGEYWLLHSTAIQHSYDAMFGGPPYGESLQNWTNHSISFNLPKIKAPLLLEVMGYGREFSFTDAPPRNLALRWEISSSLTRMGKPVELYYYPLEQHQPEHPKARLASLERNLAWFSFWLKGVEIKDPADPDRLPRWRALRQKMGPRN